MFNDLRGGLPRAPALTARMPSMHEPCVLIATRNPLVSDEDDLLGDLIARIGDGLVEPPPAQAAAADVRPGGGQPGDKWPGPGGDKPVTPPLPR